MVASSLALALRSSVVSRTPPDDTKWLASTLNEASGLLFPACQIVKFESSVLLRQQRVGGHKRVAWSSSGPLLPKPFRWPV
jgi:hypothetical protein